MFLSNTVTFVAVKKSSQRATLLQNSPLSFPLKSISPHIVKVGIYWINSDLYYHGIFITNLKLESSRKALPT